MTWLVPLVTVKGVGALSAVHVLLIPSLPVHPPPRPSPHHPLPLHLARFIIPPPSGMDVGAFAKPASEENSKAPTPLLLSTAWSPNAVRGADVLAQPDARTRSGTPAPTTLIGVLLEAVDAAAEVGPRMKSAAPTASSVPSFMTSLGPLLELLPWQVVSSSCSFTWPFHVSSPRPHPPHAPLVDEAPAEARTQSDPLSPRMCSITATSRAPVGGSRRPATDAVDRTASKVQPEAAVQEIEDGPAPRPTRERIKSAVGGAACNVVAAPSPSPIRTR